MVYGQEPCLPGNHLQPFVILSDTEDNTVPYVSGRVPKAHRLYEARFLAAEHLKNNAAKDKAHWDAIIKPQKFAINDHVLMHHENKLRGTILPIMFFTSI